MSNSSIFQELKSDSYCFLPSHVSLSLASSLFPLLIRTIAKEYCWLRIFHSDLCSLPEVHCSALPTILECPSGDGTSGWAFNATLCRSFPIALFEGLIYRASKIILSHSYHQALHFLHQELSASFRPFQVTLRTLSILSSNYRNSFVDINCWL